MGFDERNGGNSIIERVPGGSSSSDFMKIQHITGSQIEQIKARKDSQETPNGMEASG